MLFFFIQGVSQLGLNKNWTSEVIEILICWILMMIKQSKVVAGGRETFTRYRRKGS